jgi:hypothetical protein
MQVETVPVEQAVGKVQSHDLTKMVPDQFKESMLREESPAAGISAANVASLGIFAPPRSFTRQSTPLSAG